MSVVDEIDLGVNSEKTLIAEHETNLSVKCFFYTWTLSNFSKCFEFSEAKIRSPEFTFGGSRWRLWVQTIFEEDKFGEIKVCLFRSNIGDPDFYIKYRFSLLYPHGFISTKEATSSVLSESKKGIKMTFSCSESREEMLSLFQMNDKLTIICKLWILSSSVNPEFVLKNSQELELKSNCRKTLNQKSASTFRCLLANVGNALYRSLFLDIGNGKRNCRTKRNNLDKTESYTLSLSMLIVLLLFFVLLADNPTLTHQPVKSSFNTTEVNNLIIDSAIKIMNIARVFNLTELKIKSIELLTTYYEHYNVTSFQI